MLFEQNQSAESNNISPSLYALDQKLQAAFEKPIEPTGQPTLAETPVAESDTQWHETIGRFVLIKRIGQGGFANVFLAEDPLLQRQVAVKIPRSGFLNNHALLTRFELEAKAVSNLKHLNILPILEAGREHAIPYLVSPVCAIDLAQWLDRRQGQPVPIEVAVNWTRQLAEAVHHAHTRGFIHRDIKPSNILLEDAESNLDNPNQLIPKLTDFGLAKALQESGEEAITRSGDVIGTIEYMAPEQVNGDNAEVGIAADIHALGIILHELLTLRQPFRGKSRAETFHRILFAEPSFTGPNLPRLPRDLQAIGQKCLAKHSQDRYFSAAELAEDLSRFAQGKPTKARPATTWEKLIRWTRRHPLSAAALILFVVIISVFVRSILSYDRDLRRTNKQLEDRADELGSTLYAASLREATELLRQNNRDAALDLLNSLAPNPGEKDYREFTWRMLSNETMRQPVTFLSGHVDRVMLMKRSNDGHWLLSDGADRTLFLWNVLSGEKINLLENDENTYSYRRLGPVAFLLKPNRAAWWDPKQPLSLKRFEWLHQYPLIIGDPVLSITSDLQQAVAVTAKKGILTQAISTNQLNSTELPWSNPTNAPPWISSDDRWLVVRDPNQALHLWSLPELTYRGLLKSRMPGNLLALSFYPQNMITCAYDSGPAFQISLNDQTVQKTWPDLFRQTTADDRDHSNPLTPLVVHPSEQFWYFSRSNGELVEFNLSNGESKTLAQMPSAAHQLFLDPQSLLYSLDERQFQCFDLSRKQFLKTWPLPEELKGGKGLHFLRHAVHFPEHQLLALGGTEGRIALWKYENTPRPKQLLHDSRGAWNVAFSPDSQRLASSGDDSSIRIWNHRESRQELTLRGHHMLVESLAFSPDGKTLASGSYDKEARLWDMNDGKCRLVLKGPTESIRAIAWSSDGARIAAGTKRAVNKDGHICVWDAQTGELLRAWFAHQDHIRALAFSPNRRYLLSGSEDGSLKLWDVETGQLLQTQVDHQQIWALRSSGDQFFSAGEGRHISVWDWSTLTLKHRFYLPKSHHRGLALSPDGKTLAVGSEFGAMRFLQANTGLELTHVDLGKDKVLGMDISPDGACLAVACASGKIRLWWAK